MLVRRLREQAEIIANDGCRLRELLHPDTDRSAISYSLAVAWVDPGKSTLPHRLTEEIEVYYIISGTGRMHIDEESRDVETGDAIVIPAASEQWIENPGTDVLHFAAIVSPPWRLDHDIRTDGRG